MQFPPFTQAALPTRSFAAASALLVINAALATTKWALHAREAWSACKTTPAVRLWCDARLSSTHDMAVASKTKANHCLTVG